MSYIYLHSNTLLRPKLWQLSNTKMSLTSSNKNCCLDLNRNFYSYTKICLLTSQIFINTFDIGCNPWIQCNSEISKFSALYFSSKSQVPPVLDGPWSPTSQLSVTSQPLRHESVTFCRHILILERSKRAPHTAISNLNRYLANHKQNC